MYVVISPSELHSTAYAIACSQNGSPLMFMTIENAEAFIRVVLNVPIEYTRIVQVSNSYYLHNEFSDGWTQVTYD